MASAVFAWRRSSSRSRPTRPHRPIPISTLSFAAASRRHRPRSLDTAAAIWSALAGPVGLAKSTAAELALIGADPARAQRTAGQALDTVRTVIDQLTGDPFLDSTSELWTRRFGGRYFVTARCRSAAGAARRARRDDQRSLRHRLADAAIATTPNEAPSPQRGDVVRPQHPDRLRGGRQRLRADQGSPRGRRTSDERFAALSNAIRCLMLSTVTRPRRSQRTAALIPTPVLTRLGCDQGARIDVVTSNIRGVRADLRRRRSRSRDLPDRAGRRRRLQRNRDVARGQPRHRA